MSGGKPERHPSDVEHAIWFWQISGDISRLVWVLRSDRALSDADRNTIADFIEGKLKLPRGRPPFSSEFLNARARLLPQRAAAVEADRLKDEWRRMGPPAGIAKKDIGRMAIRAAAKQFGVPEDDVIRRMRLPKSKRYD